MKKIITLLCLINAVVVQAENKPNILFAISDDQSWMHTGANGDASIKTPAFDRIAREGVGFTFPYCAAPSCAPSRAAILTGRHIFELEEGGILFGLLKPKTFPIFTHLLEDAGYQTASTGKTWGPGRTVESPRPLFQKTFSKHKLAERKPGMSNNDYAANFEDFFKQRDPEKPFMFWLGTSEPHQSFHVGGWEAAGRKLEEANLPGCIPDDPVTRGEFLDYAIEIEHFDQHLARSLDVLEAAGELDDTIVIVTSDHGNPMPRSKCNLYDSGARVPLAIR
ncbi:MAG: sulfatase-like hydrolase/transferase, partial [Verrucomicrobiota bacterium]